MNCVYRLGKIERNTTYEKTQELERRNGDTHKHTQATVFTD